MYAKALVGSALLAPSLAAIVTTSASHLDPTITPGPNVELVKKQNNARFMGWVEQSGVWTSQQCEAGVTYFETAGHWRCCGTSSAGCYIPTACVNGNLIYPFTTLGSSVDVTIACTEAYTDFAYRSFTVCNTLFMYQNEEDSRSQINVNCGPSSLNWSYYRVQPEAAKTTSRSSTPRSNTAAATTANDGNTNTASPSLVPETEDKKPSSKAWIAGVVVGPILGIAIIGFLAWFCLRRKKRSKAAAAAPPATYNPHTQPAPTGPSSPPQYHSPPMQQQGAGMVPFGVADGKQNTWAPQPQSPVSQASSPTPLSMYGNQYPQQGGHAGPGQPVYNAPSPSMSPTTPQDAYAENNANYQQPHEARPFSSELDGSPQVVGVQPKHN